MGFEKLRLKCAYDSDEDDILNDFYNLVLTNSVEYCRLVGFFSSSSLAVAARGIQGLLRNDGKMKLLAGAILRKEDVRAIRDGLQEPEQIIQRAVIDDIDSIKDEFIRDHVMALGWLVAKQRLTIRIAIVTDESGTSLDAESVLRQGIFHQKVGVFTDVHGRRISFSGSVNETARAWTENVEEFKVFRDWIGSESEHFSSDYEKFYRYWNGRSRRVKTIEMPRAIREKLIQIAPNNMEGLKLEPREKPVKTRAKAWLHQATAVEALRAKSYHGVFKMATGTGKTHAALLSLQQYFTDVRRYGNRVAIIVPQHILVNQWLDDLREFFSTDGFSFGYDSSTGQQHKLAARRAWKGEFAGDQNRNVFVVIMVGSIANFTPFVVRPPDFVVGDEVHSYGTARSSRLLKKRFARTEHRLGLSATPERYYDPDGSARVFDYFGPIIYTYAIKNAQEDGVLSKYNYYPSVVELTPNEENEVEELTVKIGQHVAIGFRKEISEMENRLPKYAEGLLHKRARIIKKAHNKLACLGRILEKNKRRLRQCLVYCEDNEHLSSVQGVFDEVGMDSYVKYHSKSLNRQEALGLFKNRECNFVLSMHCLDQGVNIPSCESLILLSSSGNPREYIQRRGRVLRNPPNSVKPVVKIFDIFAFPANLHEKYRGLVMTQLLRAWEFISCSDSPEAKMQFQGIMSAYDVSDSELSRTIRRWDK